MHRQRLAAQVVVLAGVQRFEVGDAVGGQHHGFAVDDEVVLTEAPGLGGGAKKA